MKGLVTRYLRVKYESPTPYSSRDIAQVKVFLKVGQSSRSRHQKPWYEMKGLVIRYLHVKYQSPTPYSSRDIAQVKVLSTDDDDNDDDDDAEGMALALRTFSSRRAKNGNKFSSFI